MSRLLTLDNVSIRFGGLKAVSDFTFHIDDRELVGLIGPNGAGKTTCFNLITGVYAPTAGRILMGGRRIDGLSPDQINRAGIARTFQNIRLFRNLTVIDNVAVAFTRSAERGLLSTILRTPKFTRHYEQVEAQAMELLTTLG